MKRSMKVTGSKAAAAAAIVGAFAPQVVMAGPTARLTPKASAVRSYPAPAVDVPSQAGVIGPYGVGLAAAAPVGTPYLRSPAFVGPAVIYMPQTVTRVLVPGVTPYPSNYQKPTDQYIYSSAPFARTDVYVSLPFGGFHRPQGFSGTTPVEPQIPAYVPQPVSAVLTGEADYNAGNYVTEGVRPGEPGGQLTVVSGSGMAAPAPAPAPNTASLPNPAPPTAPVQSYPVAPETNLFAPDPNAAPVPSTTPAPLTLATPAPMPKTDGVASLPPMSSPSMGGEIIVDDKTPGAVKFEPSSGWTPSVNANDSYDGSSMIATLGSPARKATFYADIPSNGTYEISAWFVVSNKDYRSSKVPVTIQTADGPVTASIDQTNPDSARRFTVIGKYPLKAGQKLPVLTVTTEGLESKPLMRVSVDAIKLVKQ